MKPITKIKLFGLILMTGVIASCKKDKEVTPEVKKSPYIAQIFEYKPAPGQFINDPNYGTLDKAKSLIGTVDNGLLSLGGFGGYVVFGFDHPIENGNGADLGIFGNPLIGIGMEWAEPGIVCVMKDLNKNGLPDDGEWIELAGSEHGKSETIKNYKITYYKPSGGEDIKWTDSRGETGYLLKNGFHLQGWYPVWYTGNEVSFEGTLLKNTLVEGGIITNQPFAFGYADSGSSEYLKLQDELGRGYNTFDLDWAVDKNGQKVNLSSIDFVKVYTAQNSNGNPYHPITDNPRSRYLGEISTEIAGAIDIRLYQQQQKK